MALLAKGDPVAREAANVGQVQARVAGRRQHGEREGVGELDSEIGQPRRVDLDDFDLQQHLGLARVVQRDQALGQLNVLLRVA